MTRQTKEKFSPGKGGHMVKAGVPDVDHADATHEIC